MLTAAALSGAGRTDRPAGQPAPLTASAVFYCVNCLTEWLDPFCDECGRNLMPGRVLLGRRAEEGADGRRLLRGTPTEQIHAQDQHDNQERG